LIRNVCCEIRSLKKFQFFSRDEMAVNVDDLDSAIADGYFATPGRADLTESRDPCGCARNTKQKGSTRGHVAEIMQRSGCSGEAFHDKLQRNDSETSATEKENRYEKVGLGLCPCGGSRSRRITLFAIAGEGTTAGGGSANAGVSDEFLHHECRQG
jgi:hypothetical protein